MRTMRFAIAAVMLAVAASDLRAALIWDYSPVTTGASLSIEVWSNQSTSGNYIETVVFGSSVEVTGMDIYTRTGQTSVGNSVVVRVRGDAAGVPGSLISETVETVSVIDSAGSTSSDSVRVHVDFASPLNLAAGTYWFGMSGNSYELGLRSLMGANAPGDKRMYQFGGNVPQFPSEIGDMAFRLEGVQSTVTPEPTSLALAGFAGIGMAAGAWRRRRQQKQQAA